jgi:hypothetical protein
MPERGTGSQQVRDTGNTERERSPYPSLSGRRRAEEEVLSGKGTMLLCKKSKIEVSEQDAHTVASCRSHAHETA